MKPTLICGFPGVGKTHLCKINGWNDSDSSKFSWRIPYKDDRKHPNWPRNYIEYLSKQTKTTLISTHKVVRDALYVMDMPFSVCYPTRDCKEEYMKRYRDRGSPDAFIEFCYTCWDAWLTELERETRAKEHIVLKQGQFISDVLTGVRFRAGTIPTTKVMDTTDCSNTTTT